MTSKMTAIPGFLVLAAISTAPVHAGASVYKLLDREREIALARSAGLSPWNENATVYVLGSEGYIKAQEGTNGFSCMVGRSEPGTRWPVCFDSVGSESILPRYIREAELRLHGKTEDEVRADSARRFLSGDYHAPVRTGVAYMLSKETITSNGKTLILAPPHLMIYAPNVRSEDIGAVAHDAHSPMVLFEGDPHAYIVVFVPDSPPELTSLGPLPASER
jgi:hypothetical protein